VVRNEDKAQLPQAPANEPVRKSEVVQMHERLERPDSLLGTTYKIKPPVADHALYITINDIVLNEGTEHERRQPFEIFINSKNMEHFQWIVALTRIVSAVFARAVTSPSWSRSSRPCSTRAAATGNRAASTCPRWWRRSAM